jgi:CubicO group peptidase (beta-lactamase class C family)
MKFNHKIRIKYAIIAVLIAGLSWSLLYINSLLPIATGYAAKYLCSAIFISNRQQAEVEALDLDFSIIQFVRNEVNYSDKSVTSHLLWGKSRAIFRNNLGSILVIDNDETKIRNQQYERNIKDINTDTLAWPMGNKIATNTNSDTALNTIANQLINKQKYGGNVFAFIIANKNDLIIERYSPHIQKDTRLISWSMAKSFTNALVGIMVKENKINICKPTDLAQWQNDNRKNITINDLMHMQSGLQWNEEYGNRSDVTLMLNCQKNFAEYAIDQPLKYQAGTHWYYSSGTTNIVNFLLRKKFANNQEYFEYSNNQLFKKIGIQNAIFEVDATGTQVGSSYIYATARDYARFGLLYLQNGKFNGQQILPENWVSYTTTPASDSKNSYGAFFWLNKNHYYPAAPEDMYSCNGHDGQRIFIIPSKEMVIVVLGYSPKAKNGIDFNLLLHDILNKK